MEYFLHPLDIEALCPPSSSNFFKHVSWRQAEQMEVLRVQRTELNLPMLTHTPTMARVVSARFTTYTYPAAVGDT